MARLTRAAAGLMLAAAFATPALAQQPGTAPQQLRFAYINSQVILANTPGRAEAESVFAREMAVARTEVQRMQATLDSAGAEYQRTQLVMTPQARQTRENELRQLDQRTRQRAGELDQQMQAREAELTAPIMQRINAVIEGVRAEFNYAFVFDVAAQGGVIVAADRTLDISPLIIQRLQAGGAPAAPTTSAPARPAPDSTRPAANPPARPGLRPRP